MHFASYQPHASRALGLFAQQARGIEMTGSPGFRGVVRRPTGLGDWFTDAISTVHTNVMDAVDTFTGAKSRREEQQAAVAIAQAQAASQQAQTQTWANAIPWVVGGVAVVAVAAVLTRR